MEPTLFLAKLLVVTTQLLNWNNLQFKESA